MPELLACAPVEGWRRSTVSYPARWWRWTVRVPIRVGLAALMIVAVVVPVANEAGAHWTLRFEIVGALAFVLMVAFPRWFWAGRTVVRIATKHDAWVRTSLESLYARGVPSQAAYRAVVDGYRVPPSDR